MTTVTVPGTRPAGDTEEVKPRSVPVAQSGAGAAPAAPAAAARLSPPEQVRHEILTTRGSIKAKQIKSS